MLSLRSKYVETAVDWIRLTHHTDISLVFVYPVVNLPILYEVMNLLGR